MKEEILQKYKEWRRTYIKPDFSISYDDLNDCIFDFVELFTRGQLCTFFEEILEEDNSKMK